MFFVYLQVVPRLELCIPFNCHKLTVFKICRNHKTRTYFRFFHSRKMRLLAFWAFLQTEITDFPTLSRLSAYMYTWYPFRAGPLIQAVRVSIPQARLWRRRETPGVVFDLLVNFLNRNAEERRQKLVL